jgi:hypothetical protein
MHMRIAQFAVLVLVGGLAAPALLLGGAAPPGPAAPDATGSAIETKEAAFDIFVEKTKVGQAQVKSLAVSGTAILSDEVSITVQNVDMGYQTQQIWQGGDKPLLQRAKASTHAGAHKLMEGTLVLSVTGAGPVLATAISGYADREGKLYEKPLTENKETPVPAGLVLTHRALMQFAAAILTRPGQKDNIVYMHFPLSVEYPRLVSFTPNCRLVRQPPTPEGNSVFVLKQLFPGGNEEQVASVTLDKTGSLVETQAARYTWRLHKPAPPAKPADPKATGGK